MPLCRAYILFRRLRPNLFLFFLRETLNAFGAVTVDLQTWGATSRSKWVRKKGEMAAYDDVRLEFVLKPSMRPLGDFFVK